jgi:transcriptional regulator with XRE-family HTH domain
MSSRSSTAPLPAATPENGVDTTALGLASLFRGLYNRVARELGVDPSYVSRVARGERRSELVQAALAKEMSKILGRAGTPNLLSGTPNLLSGIICRFTDSAPEPKVNTPKQKKARPTSGPRTKSGAAVGN